MHKVTLVLSEDDFRDIDEAVTRRQAFLPDFPVPLRDSDSNKNGRTIALICREWLDAQNK